MNDKLTVKVVQSNAFPTIVPAKGSGTLFIFKPQPAYRVTYHGMITMFHSKRELNRFLKEKKGAEIVWIL